MTRRMRIGLVAAFGLLLAIWLFSGPSKTVDAAQLRAGTAVEVVYATGIVEPVDWAAVAPLLRARIVEICDCEGETVEAGAMIFRLDDSEARARMAALDAQLALARRELERATQLLTRGIGSQAAADKAAALLAELEASKAAQSEILKTYVSTAPLDGQVLRLDAVVGETATPGEALAWVGRPLPKHVVAEVNEEDVPRIQVGQRALLKGDAFPGRPLRATVASITPKGDPVLKTYRVRLALPDDTPLFIGMTVEVNVIVREVEDATLAPAAAIAAFTFSSMAGLMTAVMSFMANSLVERRLSARRSVTLLSSLLHCKMRLR